MNIILGTTMKSATMDVQDVSVDVEFSADLESLLGKKLLVQAMSGAGKSWLIRRILEQVFGHVQIIVLDSEGDFRTLREQYPYVLAGGDQGDVPVSVELAQPLAHKLLELRTSAIIDISDLPVGKKENERCDFVSEFLTALLRSPQKLWHPTLIVLDEAQEFAPERFSASSTEAVIQMAGQARKRGFGLVLATNRLSDLSKSAAAHCKSKLIGGSMGLDAQKATVELGLPPRDRALFQDLDEGQFYAIGPAFEKGVHLVQIGDVKTTHPSPSGRELTSIPPPPKEVKTALRELSALKPPDQEKADAANSTTPQQGKVTPCNHQLEITKLRRVDQEQLAKILQLEGMVAARDDEVVHLQQEFQQANEQLVATRQFQKALVEFMPTYQVTDGEHVERIPLPFDEEEFLQKVLARMPTNGQSVQVTPPEALRKKYLTQAVDRSYEKISAVTEKPRRAMEVLLSNPVFWSNGAVAKAVGAGHGGSQAQTWREALKELLTLGLVKKGGNGGSEYKADVHAFVAQELSVHSPTDQEVDGVVQHGLAKVVAG